MLSRRCWRARSVTIEAFPLDILAPGIGYGGSCLPKDVAALCHMGDSAGVTMRVLSAVAEVQRKAAEAAQAELGRNAGPSLPFVP